MGVQTRRVGIGRVLQWHDTAVGSSHDEDTAPAPALLDGRHPLLFHEPPTRSALHSTTADGDADLSARLGGYAHLLGRGDMTE